MFRQGANTAQASYLTATRSADNAQRLAERNANALLELNIANAENAYEDAKLVAENQKAATLADYEIGRAHV